MAQIKIGNIIYGSTFASDITYKDTTVEKKLDLMPIFDITDNANVNYNNDYLTYANILDSLNSSDTDKALSANQGRILNEKFDNIDFSELENGITINSEQIHNLNLDLEDFSKSFNNEYISNCDIFEEIEKEITKRGQMSTFCLSFGGDLINAPADNWIWFSVLYKNARIIAFNKDSIAILHRNNGVYDGWKIINPDNITSLNNKVPFSFGIDANGNYGYIKDGADTVTPFKTGKHDIILVGTGEINTNYTTKVGYCFPIYERGLITYSTNNVSWSSGATTNYITFTTNEAALDILFMIDVQTTTTVCTPYITGADYILTGGNMVASGTKDNSYYRARLTNITGKVTVGCKLSYGAMYTMMLMTE